MPKLSVGTLTVAQVTQKTASVVLINKQEVPSVETFFIITNNNEPLVTNNNDNLTYGT
jgi:hypothetical protein